MRTLGTFSYRKVATEYKGLNEAMAELEEIAGNWANAANYWTQAAKVQALKTIPKELESAHLDYINSLVKRAHDCRVLAIEESEAKEEY